MKPPLISWSDEIKGLNVFSHVTFRAVAAAVTAFVLSLAFLHLVIRKLVRAQGRPADPDGRTKCIGCRIT